jgi:Protein of unknown function (DUF4007)
VLEVNPGFSGHETFPFRYGWLKKGVDALLERPDIFVAPDSTSRLGVGKNMVKSIRHWCLATSVFEEFPLPESRKKGLRVSPFGLAVLAENGFDPYLEDQATLWLLHFQLTCQPGRSQTWHWLFSHYVKREFTRGDLTLEMMAAAQSTPSSRASRGTIKRDVDCFVRTYVPSRSRKSLVLEDTLDCPLIELGLINELADHETLAFDGGERASLSDEVFSYCLLNFWESYQPQKSTCSIETLSYAPGSPGRVFRLADRELVSRLEKLENLTNGSLGYDETAGLKQVYRKSNLPSADFLSQVYGEQGLKATR